MRRLAIVAAALLALVLAAAASAGKPVIDKAPMSGVTFTLSWETCPNLPTGTVITGTGDGHSITLTKDSTVRNETQIHGTATDQDGNTYVFNYENSFTVSSTDGTGVMVDSFSLAGNGPARLNNGFRANVNLATGEFDPLSQRGDPIDFTTSPPQAMCDPL
jgi:hypothetical protein